MELKDLITLYNFGKPLKVLLYTEKPFCVTSESYVVDGKLIADNGDIVCNDVNVLDYKHGYNLFMVEHDTDCLIAKISRTNDKLAYYTKLCDGDEKLGYRTMYDVEYCKRMGF